MDTFLMVSIGILSAMTGFWIGRSLQWQLADVPSDAGIRTESGEFLQFTEMEGREKRARKQDALKLTLGEELGCPTAGELSTSVENGKHMVRIQPTQGKIYAPAAGRITKLYPMGSAMVLQTDAGAELFLQAGENVNDMHSMLYRCRVMEREVVRKGSLLLEYDIAGLEAEGINPAVTVCLENGQELEKVAMTGSSRAKMGETILCVVSGTQPNSYERFL